MLFKFLLNIAMVDAGLMYKEVQRVDTCILPFRKSVVFLPYAVLDLLLGKTLKLLCFTL